MITQSNQNESLDIQVKSRSASEFKREISKSEQESNVQRCWFIVLTFIIIALLIFGAKKTLAE